MRATVQRVSSASVTVGGKVINSIGKGLCVLLGICREDTEADVKYMVRKILNMRIFEDPQSSKRWDKSVKDFNLEILCISQFTLYGRFKGNSFDFHHAMNPEQSQEMYNNFLIQMKECHNVEKIKDGIFGAMMSVNIVNDGPVTINIDSRANNKDNGQAATMGDDALQSSCVT